MAERFVTFFIRPTIPQEELLLHLEDFEVTSLLQNLRQEEILRNDTRAISDEIVNEDRGREFSKVTISDLIFLKLFNSFSR